MTLAELISEADKLRPNQYNTNQKTAWVTEIEGTIVDEVMNLAEGDSIEFEGYIYERDEEKKLMVPDRFSDIYISYLLAKIDFYDGETDRYNNDVILYQSAYDQFTAWYRRRHMPKQTAYFRGF